jgi:hypothetical protein
MAGRRIDVQGDVCRVAGDVRRERKRGRNAEGGITGNGGGGRRNTNGSDGQSRTSEQSGLHLCNDLLLVGDLGLHLRGLSHERLEHGRQVRRSRR